MELWSYECECPRIKKATGDLGLSLDFVDLEVLVKMVETEDDVGCVLRSHLVLEQFLNVYVSDRVGVKNFFSEMRLRFSDKLNIAERLGLNYEIFAALKMLNRIRNNIAHESNFCVEINDVEKLKSAVWNVRFKGEKFPTPEDMKLYIAPGGRADKSQTYDFSTGDVRVKFILVVGGMLSKCTFWLHKDAVERRQL